jgi:hypothetical protein
MLQSGHIQQARALELQFLKTPLIDGLSVHLVGILVPGNQDKRIGFGPLNHGRQRLEASLKHPLVWSGNIQMKIDAADRHRPGENIRISDPKHTGDPAATGKTGHVNAPPIQLILRLKVLRSIQREAKAIERYFAYFLSHMHPQGEVFVRRSLTSMRQELSENRQH